MTLLEDLQVELKDYENKNTVHFNASAHVLAFFYIKMKVIPIIYFIVTF